MLNKGMLHKDIAKELGVSTGWVSRVALDNGLSRKKVFQNNGASNSFVSGGSTLEELRCKHKFEIGEKVSVRIKGDDDEQVRSERVDCKVEQITDCIVFCRGLDGLMYTVSFPRLGMDSRAVVRR